MERSVFQMKGLEGAFEKALSRARVDGFFERLCAHDATLWKEGGDDIALIENALGWLSLPATMGGKAADIEGFAGEVRDGGFTEAVLLGMGGSSLAPLVMAGVFGGQARKKPGWPRLTVLDSTDPVAIGEVMARVTAKTLFIVSSKSGSTVEPNTLFSLFYDVIENTSLNNPGDNFVAITDPGSQLETLSRERSFRRVFLNPPDIGGRFSALSYFGLVPAAIAGVEIERLLEGAARALEQGAEEGVRLGAALGAAALAGRDKVTLFTSEGLPAFGLWVEQLLAESTGKEGRGLVPVTGEPLGSPTDYGADRVFVDVRIEGEDGRKDGLAPLTEAGHPVIRLTLATPYDLGLEFMRWEVATALAGRMLGINPFDQPDVESAKVLARARLEAEPSPPPGELMREGGVRAYVGEKTLVAPGVRRALEEGGIAPALAALLRGMAGGAGGDYIALLTYYSPFDRDVASITRGLQALLMKETGHAVQAGFGPRYLHSTGQIHKGGPNSGVFFLFTHAAPPDIEVPGASFTFFGLELSQAYGDMEALTKKDRRVVLFETDSPSASDFDEAVDIIRRAVTP